MNNLSQYILEKFKISKNTNITPEKLIDKYSVGDICLVLTHHIETTSSLHDYIILNVGKISKINQRTIILDRLFNTNGKVLFMIFKFDNYQDKGYKYLVSSPSNTQTSILIYPSEVLRIVNYIKNYREFNFVKLLKDNILALPGADSVYKSTTQIGLKRTRLLDTDFDEIEKIIKN